MKKAFEKINISTQFFPNHIHQDVITPLRDKDLPQGLSIELGFVPKL